MTATCLIVTWQYLDQYLGTYLDETQAITYLDQTQAII